MVVCAGVVSCEVGGFDVVDCIDVDCTVEVVKRAVEDVSNGDDDDDDDEEEKEVVVTVGVGVLLAEELVGLVEVINVLDDGDETGRLVVVVTAFKSP